MEWRSVVGYEGLYEVSDSGLIRSLPRRGTRSKSIQIRKACNNNKGYKQVCLSKDGKTKMAYIHRIVAQAFISNPDNLPEINHKDENPLNNNISNLEWCDRTYNNRYGSRSQKTRKSVDMLDSNGNFVKRFDGLGIAAVEVSGKKSNQSCIKECCDGERKTAIGFRWRWSE